MSQCCGTDISLDLANLVLPRSAGVRFKWFADKDGERFWSKGFSVEVLASIFLFPET
jgi:hypothetical protein